MDLFARFGATIRRLRVRAGYSQESFADHVGMHRNYIGTVERGETNITLENIARIAKGLQIPMNALFTELEGNESDAASDAAASRTIAGTVVGAVSQQARTAHLQPALNRVAEAHQALQDAAQHLQRLAITSDLPIDLSAKPTSAKTSHHKKQ